MLSKSLKRFYQNSRQIIFDSPLCDQIASITITSILGFLPVMLMLLFLIYHSPMLTHYQEIIENFIFTALSNEQTAQTLSQIKTQIPTIVDFNTSTLLSLFFMAYFFIATLAFTINKIVQQKHRFPLHLKLFGFILLFIIMVIVANKVSELAFSYWWFKITFRALALYVLFNIILPDHRHISIVKTVLTTVVVQIIFNFLLVYYYTVFNDYHMIYGQLAGIAILLTWLYLSWFILFYIIQLQKEHPRHD